MNNADLCLKIVTNALQSLQESGATEIPNTFIRGYYKSKEGVEVQYRVRRTPVKRYELVVTMSDNYNVKQETRLISENVDAALLSLISQKKMLVGEHCVK